jgi:hypothetical protein
VRDGVDVCPFCAHPLERVGERGTTRSLRLELAGRTVTELVVEQGVGLVLGRWGGAGSLPLDEFVPAAAVATVSRRHVRFDLAPLGLFVHDLGSANGTWLRLGASRVRLDPSVCVTVTDESVIELAAAVALVPGGVGGHAGRSIVSSGDVTSDGTRLEIDPPAPGTRTAHQERDGRGGR